MNCMMCFNCINYLNTIIVQIHTVVKMELENQKNRRYFIENVIKYSLDNGLAPVGLTFSPVTGAKGNIEFLLYIDGKTSQTAEAAISHEQIEKIVDASHEELE